MRSDTHSQKNAGRKPQTIYRRQVLVLRRSLKKKNFDGKGEQDARDWLADVSLACLALLYVAEFASDKCRIVPLPERKGGNND